MTGPGRTTPVSPPSRRTTRRTEPDLGPGAAVGAYPWSVGCGAAGPGPPLALVHGLDPGNRNGVALRDQVGRQPLRLGHPVSPRIAPVEQARHGPQGEI